MRREPGNDEARKSLALHLLNSGREGEALGFSGGAGGPGKRSSSGNSPRTR